MALKAGRVGVAPDQVDEFGKIKSDATEGYTKQEADAKFETQIHAVSTYETKSDAATLQPIRLSVPITLLNGSALEVESALQGINDEVTNVVTGHVTSEVATFTVETIKKVGRVVSLSINLTLTDDITAWTTNVITVPDGFETSAYFGFLVRVASDDVDILQADANGKNFVCSKSLSTGAVLRADVTYIV